MTDQQPHSSPIHEPRHEPRPSAPETEQGEPTPPETITNRTTVEFVRPWLYPKQLAAIYDGARLSYIEASTKAGKTVGCIAWLVELALLAGGEGRSYWWVAPVSAQARIAFRRMLRFLPRGTFTANRTEHTIVLMNGSIIWFMSGDHPDSLYGEDVYGAVVDEASRLKEDAWVALRSTVAATRGPIRCIGNVKGRRNWFYRGARRAEQLGPGRFDVAYHKITATDAVAAGVLVAEEIEAARGDMPEHEWRQLFFAEAADDTGNPFGISAIAACVKGWSQRPARVWAWDLARKQDYTVGIALDDHGGVCQLERYPPKALHWGEIKRRIRKATGRLPALVDSTGVGDPIVEDLQLGGEFAGEKFGPAVNFEGYQFTPASKQKLMVGLAAAIQNKQLAFPSRDESPLVGELEAFEYVYTPGGGVKYSAPEGLFDDCVCALALAVSHAVHAPRPMTVTAGVLAAARMPSKRPMMQLPPGMGRR